ncbi:MAG: hypothetical protein PWP15_229 [Methanothermococcus sp.]|uniref:4Fe-4S binding protein n=1 Tax=Methanothermococcus TaxID=155862 RepID=UPI0003614124|nr:MULTISPECIES: 4Fe-4S binding protein [Methanothermococcus]MDK2789722.1 hypothetical protein [Methanothermococcus sp.]MDK2986937.1 hypothetical protein [Methanothermococcus sp.]
MTFEQSEDNHKNESFCSTGVSEESQTRSACSIKIKKPLKKVISDISNNLNIEEEKIRSLLKDTGILNEKNLYIDPKRCVRCSLCYEECPVDAISKPSVKNPAEIIPEKCVKCEICAKTCPVGAIDVLEGEAHLEGDDIVYILKEIQVPHRKVRLKKYELDKEKCIKCGICERFCPTKAINVEKRKNIEVNLNLCMGCTACEKVCPKDAIKVYNELGDIVFNKDITLDNTTCVTCLACVDQCPVGAISETEEGVKINKNECIFCGRCEKICPVSAIEIKPKYE